MTGVFGTIYASLYDDFYEGKEYDRECDILEAAFAKRVDRPVKRILDLGCGTGGHAIELASRGFHVVGVDRSAEMVEICRTKARGAELDIRTIQADIREIDLDSSFDAAVLMFAVLGYQPTNQDVLKTLIGARRHLEHGGALVFDCWFGPAVLTLRPEERTVTVSTDRGDVRRHSSGELMLSENLCEVQFRLERPSDEDDEPFEQESHTMRYFFPKELELLLDLAGFSEMEIRSFPDLDPPSADTWNVLVTAAATDEPKVRPEEIGS